MLGQFYGSFYHDYSKIKNQEYKNNVKEEFFFSNIKIHWMLDIADEKVKS